jgi:2-polyprenyl-3-methyl-5-hydroxy-6-metoxy-1,4-benzoquinol methylase
MNINNFHSVSEYPDIKVPVEQVKRLNERYNFAKKFSNNKNVLEIGCGSGQGSKLINSVAKKYTGIDVDEKLLEIAKLNNPNLEFLKKDFQDKDLTFNFEEKFDVIIVFEMIYYIDDLESFFLNISKVLNKNGKILMCSANKDLLGFTPGKYTKKYFNNLDIKNFIEKFNLKVSQGFGGTKVKKNLKFYFMSIIKLIATNLNLIPSNMKNKGLLKKIYYGGIFINMPKHVLDIEDVNIDEIKITKNTDYKVIFSVLTLKE